MDPVFRKCLIAIEKINDDILPAMGYAYKQYIEQSKVVILQHQCLNESRKFAKAAIEALNSNRIDNKNVKKYLEQLKDLDGVLDKRSRSLHGLLSDIQNRFLKVSKKMAQNNHSFLKEMKNGTTPAEELLQKVVSLGKEIQKVINEEIPTYKYELNSHMKDTEQKVCDDAYRFYNKTVTLDPGTFPAIRSREWTHIPDNFFLSSGAFVFDEYNKTK